MVIKYETIKQKGKRAKEILQRNNSLPVQIADPDLKQPGIYNCSETATNSTLLLVSLKNKILGFLIFFCIGLSFMFAFVTVWSIIEIVIVNLQDCK